MKLNPMEEREVCVVWAWRWLGITREGVVGWSARAGVENLPVW